MTLENRLQHRHPRTFFYYNNISFAPNSYAICIHTLQYYSIFISHWHIVATFRPALLPSPNDDNPTSGEGMSIRRPDAAKTALHRAGTPQSDDQAV